MENQYDRRILYYEKDEQGNRTGRTIVVLHNGDLRHVGISNCGRRDNFNRKLGRSIAMGRAIHALEITKGTKPPRTTPPRHHFTVEVGNGPVGVDIPTWMLEPAQVQLQAQQC